MWLWHFICIFNWTILAAQKNEYLESTKNAYILQGIDREPINRNRGHLSHQKITISLQ